MVVFMGAVAIGLPLAIGALAIGFVAVGRLRIGYSWASNADTFDQLEVDTLTVGAPHGEGIGHRARQPRLAFVGSVAAPSLLNRAFHDARERAGLVRWAGQS